jgi:hypothetical protein
VPAAGRERDRDRDGHHDDQHGREPELEGGRHAQSEHVRDENGTEHRETHDRRDERPGPREVGDVVAADERDGRRAEQHGAQEPPATACRMPSAAKVIAGGAERTSSAAQAMIDAAPADCAASAGTRSTPGPISAPT